jgi:uncharacterized protein with PIN domain/sulfur carrier protein ThiS
MIHLRFYEELNDFLPAERRKVAFTHELTRRTSIKDVIESFGVPHTEVEIILINGESVDFSTIVQDGDRISVYPVFESIDVFPLIKPFVIDSNLGRLARYLRMLGFDCLYSNTYTDKTIATIASEQHRTVLTRDRTLLRRKVITHGYFVREVRPRFQVKEVLTRFDLTRLIQPFTRCINCNGELAKVEKQAVIHLLEPKTKKYYDSFKQCPDCQQIYWKGSHHQRAMALINELTQPSERSPILE